jgi:hypothetical protein
LAQKGTRHDILKAFTPRENTTTVRPWATSPLPNAKEIMYINPEIELERDTGTGVRNTQSFPPRQTSRHGYAAQGNEPGGFANLQRPIKMGWTLSPYPTGGQQNHNPTIAQYAEATIGWNDAIERAALGEFDGQPQQTGCAVARISFPQEGQGHRQKWSVIVTSEYPVCAEISESEEEFYNAGDRFSTCDVTREALEAIASLDYTAMQVEISEKLDSAETKEIMGRMSAFAQRGYINTKRFLAVFKALANISQGAIINKTVTAGNYGADQVLCDGCMYDKTPKIRGPIPAAENEMTNVSRTAGFTPKHFAKADELASDVNRATQVAADAIAGAALKKSCDRNQLEAIAQPGSVSGMMSTNRMHVAIQELAWKTLRMISHIGMKYTAV